MEVDEFETIGEEIDDGSSVILRLSGKYYRFHKIIDPFQTDAKINPVEYTMVQSAFSGNEYGQERAQVLDCCR